MCRETWVCGRVHYGGFLNAKGFTTNLGYLDNIPIANVLYAYDAANDETIILEVNNSIYLCDKIDDLLLKPIQAEESGIRVDTCTNRYYPDEQSVQVVSLLSGTTIPVLYDGVLLYLKIIRPTKDTVHNFRRLQIISKYPWGPFLLNDNFACM